MQCALQYAVQSVLWQYSERVLEFGVMRLACCKTLSFALIRFGGENMIWRWLVFGYLLTMGLKSTFRRPISIVKKTASDL